MLRWRDITKSILVILAAISIAFIALYLGETAVRPDGMTVRPSVEFVAVNKEGFVTENAKPHLATYSNSPVYRSTADKAGSRVAFLIPFDMNQPQSGLAFFLGPTPGLQEIRLNGNVIQPNIPLDTFRGASDGKALYYILPQSFVKSGKNEIQVLVETQSSVLALAPFHIGSAVEAARATGMVELITSNVPIMAISFLIFATLLCLVVNWPSEDSPRIRSLVLVMIIWALRTYFITFQTPFEVPFLVTSFLYYLLEVSLICAFARHLLAGENVASGWKKKLNWLWAILVLYLTAITLAGFVIGPAIRDWYKALAMASSFLFLVLATTGLSALAWGFVIRNDGRRLERIALMLCLLALFVDASDAAFGLSIPFAALPLTFYAAAPAGLLLGLGVVASIAREASEARRTVLRSNEILGAKLVEQNAELARSYDAQKQMLQRQVMLEERQRIVRDMHDGIGGQLLGLMMQVRSGGVEPQQVEQGLQSSIADLRLIVDSMDTAEDSLAETLRSFEHRVRAQVETVGIAFKAEHGLDEASPGPGPRPTLQILRILQEAVTNAMRHSGATEIALSSHEDTQGMIHISIVDNGKGLPDQIKGGRGLTSMRSRAEAVGGVLEIESSSAGTRLTLAFPKPE